MNAEGGACPRGKVNSGAVNSGAVNSGAVNSGTGHLRIDDGFCASWL
jgi:hypothetical protein